MAMIVLVCSGPDRNTLGPKHQLYHGHPEVQVGKVKPARCGGRPPTL